MRHVRHCLALLPLLAAGCRYPEDPIFAYGRALNPDGSPLAGVPLTVERAPPRAFDAPPPEAPATFSPYGTSTTQANGDFTLRFVSSDVEDWSRINEYRQYSFRVALPLEDGEGTFVSFIFSGDMELPPLQLWNAHLAVGDGPQGPTLSFVPAPPAPELPPSATLRTVIHNEPGTPEQEEVKVPTTTPEPIVQLFSGGERLWMQPGVSAPWVPGPYVLEDFASPEAQLRAVTLGTWNFSPLGSISSYVSFRQEWRTARVPLSAGASRRPVSRGASCQPSPPGACPWTDGRLTPMPFVDDETQGSPSALIVTLAEPTHLRRAVIRGLEYTHALEGSEHLRLAGSADGERWFPLGSRLLSNRTPQEATALLVNGYFAEDTSWDSPFGDGKLEQYDQAPLFLDLPVETPEPVRHVRLSVDTEGSGSLLSSLAEVSLFE